MVAFITVKKSLLIYFCALLVAGGSALLLDYLLGGPRLGFHYDFLLKHRKGPQAAPELLIVDSDELVEPDTAAEMILTLIELDASTLLIQTPILGFSPGRINSGEEIRYRFDEEFSLLERNIRNLFEAIRVGSIAPSEVRRYVDDLVDLTDRGKERLTAALIHQDEAGIVRLERAARAFGQVYRTEAGAGALGGTYSRPDWDGKVRRIAPVSAAADSEAAESTEAEHVAYAALKGRYQESVVGNTGTALYLVNTIREGEVFIPLDSRGNLLFEVPDMDEGFRRISLDLFIRYREAGQTLQRLLREAVPLGIYSLLEPESSPVHLFDYAQAQREEYLVSADPGNPAAERFSAEWKARWLHTLEDYYAALEELLYGETEDRLKAGYGELLASERLGEGGIAEITALQDGLTRAFEDLRTAHRELWVLRETLSRALASSFVIMGPPAAGPGYADSELSYLLANSIISGQSIRPLGSPMVLLWSILVIMGELLILVRLSPPLALGAGAAMSFLAGAGFSWGFIITGTWLDPLIPLISSLAGTVMVFGLGLLAINQGAQLFRHIYGPKVGKPCLRQLIKAGRPSTAHLSAPAAIIAVRRAGLLALEDQGNNPAVAAFREEVSTLFKRAGGVIIGCDGDLVLACFGSPLERIGAGPGRDPYMRYTYTPALRSAEFIAELAVQKIAVPWRFGLDAGECTFGYQPISGYCAYGRPVVRARVLSGLAARYKVRALVSESVRSQLKDIPVRKLNVPQEPGVEAFYQLVFRDPRLEDLQKKPNNY